MFHSDRTTAQMKKKRTLLSLDGTGLSANITGIHLADLLIRLLGFGACLIGAAVCFTVSFITLPFLALRPAKFALSFRFVAILGIVIASNRFPQSRKSVGHVRLRGPCWPIKPPQTPHIKRAAPVLIRLYHEPGINALLLDRCTQFCFTCFTRF